MYLSPLYGYPTEFRKHYSKLNFELSSTDKIVDLGSVVLVWLSVPATSKIHCFFKVYHHSKMGLTIIGFHPKMVKYVV